MLTWPWKRSQLVPSGFFVLRTPLLPFERFAVWSDGPDPVRTTDRPDRGPDAARAERARLRARLAAALDEPEVREALFVGSPDLEGAVDLWKQDAESGRGPGLERALVRYFTRMSSRPTPFGLFAGCSLGKIGRRTRLELTGVGEYRRRTELDVRCLSRLRDGVLAEPSVRENLRHTPNSTLHRAAGTIRYVEVPADGRSHPRRLVAVRSNAAIDAVLDHSAPATLAELASVLTDASVPPGDARLFVDELVSHQILVQEIGIPVTGSEGLTGLLDQVRPYGFDNPVLARWEAVAAALAELGASGVGIAPRQYHRIQSSLKELGGSADLNRTFQVQLVKPVVTATLGTTVIDEIIHGIAVLHRLARRRGGTDIETFREDFVRRYGGREVPLLEALDDEIGVGFGATHLTAPLLDCLPFPTLPQPPPEWRGYEDYLLDRLSDLGPDDRELVLDQSDIAAMAERDPPPLADALSVLATVAARGDEALDRGRFQVYLRAVGGPSGAWLLGRFCHADPSLRAEVERHLADEEAHDPEAIWAEVVHLPAGPYGNVVRRPVLRRYEIPYLGASGAAPDRQIPASDLLVAVRAGRVQLRSRRLGRRVIPRLTTAHDFRIRSLPVYRFLCELQFEGVVGGLSWSWGGLAGAPFLPRVRLGRLVFATARWGIGRDELEGLGTVGGEGFSDRVARWRAARRLPRLVQLVDDDKSLAIDFDNALSVEAFADLARIRDHVTLEELFPGPDELCVRGPEGTYVHEVVVPFVAEAGTAAGRRSEHPPGAHGDTVARRSSPGGPRRFPPWSEWLYAKLYAPASVLDDLLRDVIAPLVEWSRQREAIDAWHFVRFGDPDWHLRVRLHGEATHLRGGVHASFEEALVPFLTDGRVWRVQFDTYEREVERYGGPEAVLAAEQIFSADSDMAVEVLSRLPPGDRGEDERWRTAAVATALLLDDLGLSEDEKLFALRDAQQFVATQLNVDGRLRGALGLRFRGERADLEARLQEARTVGPAVGGTVHAIRARSLRLAPAAAELHRLEESGRLWAPVAELAVSYIHMGLNRLLRSSHRRQELVIYDFLSRLQLSRMARRDRG